MAVTMEATEADSALESPDLIGTSMTLGDPSNSNSFSSDLRLYEGILGSEMK